MEPVKKEKTHKKKAHPMTTRSDEEESSSSSDDAKTSDESLVAKGGPITRVPRYRGDGEQDVLEWIEQFRWIVQMNGWTDEKARSYFGAAMEGPAARWVRGVPDFNKAKLEDLCKALLAQFGETEARAKRALAAEARSKKQGSRESVASYAAVHHDLCARAGLAVEDELELFCAGLRRSLRKQVLATDPSTRQEAVKRARAAERADAADSSEPECRRRSGRSSKSGRKAKTAAARTRKHKSSKRAVSPSLSPSSLSSSSHSDTEPEPRKQPDPAQAEAQKELKELRSAVMALTHQFSLQQRRGPPCFVCGQVGHMMRDCPKLTPEERAVRQAAFERWKLQRAQADRNRNRRTAEEQKQQQPGNGAAEK